MNPLAKRRILVVDDDPGNLELARRMLGRLPGVEVATASSGPDCLWIAEREAYDTVLMDINLPRLNGMIICGVLRRMPGYDTARIIACTAHGTAGGLEDLDALGFDGLLRKPFLVRQLYDALSLS